MFLNDATLDRCSKTMNYYNICIPLRRTTVLAYLSHTQYTACQFSRQRVLISDRSAPLSTLIDGIPVWRPHCRRSVLAPSAGQTLKETFTIIQMILPYKDWFGNSTQTMTWYGRLVFCLPYRCDAGNVSLARGRREDLVMDRC